MRENKRETERKQDGWRAGIVQKMKPNSKLISYFFSSTCLFIHRYILNICNVPIFTLGMDVLAGWGR